jgi:hypothetical protein
MLFVRWKCSGLFLFSWWRGWNWDDRKHASHYRIVWSLCTYRESDPYKVRLSVHSYVYLYLYWHCFNRRASCHGSLYGGCDASVNFTHAFSICIQISRIYHVQAHQYFSCILCFPISYGACQGYTQSLSKKEFWMTVAIEFCFPYFTFLDIACPPGSLIKNSMWTSNLLGNISITEVFSACMQQNINKWIAYCRFGKPWVLMLFLLMSSPSLIISCDTISRWCFFRELDSL